MKKQILLISIVLLFLSACTSEDEKALASITIDSAYGSWMNRTTVFKDTMNVNSTSLISIFNDGSCTELDNNGHYYYGTWKARDSNHLMARLSENKEHKIEINYLDKENSNKIILLDNNYTVIKKFKKFAGKTVKTIDDPFHPSNNIWRYKATKPETIEELNTRLADMIHHNALILKSAIERNQTSVSFEYSPSIIKVYAGGIGICEEAQIPSLWINYFYNEVQALKVYRLFDYYLSTLNYKKLNPKTWYEADYNILNALHHAIITANPALLEEKIANLIKEKSKK